MRRLCALRLGQAHSFPAQSRSFTFWRWGNRPGKVAEERVSDTTRWRAPRSVWARTARGPGPACRTHPVDGQVDVSPQPPVVHQPPPTVTDPAGGDRRERNPDPASPFAPLPPPPRGEAAPGEANPVPHREVREDLQQHRVRQVRKRGHAPPTRISSSGQRSSGSRPGAPPEAGGAGCRLRGRHGSGGGGEG